MNRSGPKIFISPPDFEIPRYEIEYVFEIFLTPGPIFHAENLHSVAENKFESSENFFYSPALCQRKRAPKKRRGQNQKKQKKHLRQALITLVILKKKKLKTPRYMVGLDLKAIGCLEPDSRSYRLFRQIFGQELSCLEEYSFDSTSESVGTCILGSSPSFLDRFYQFVSPLSFYQENQECIERMVQKAKPNDFALKADWRNNEVYQLTLYFRYNKRLDFEAASQWQDEGERGIHWKGPSPRDLIKIFGVEYPFCFGIRFGMNRKLIYSCYIDFEMEGGAFYSKIPALLQSYNWSPKLAEEIEMDVKDLSSPTLRGCIGMESTGEILKLDFTGLGFGKVLKFLRKKETSENRIHELVDMARRLNQIQTNYFAMKYDLQGFSGWKVYFAVVHQK